MKSVRLKYPPRFDEFVEATGVDQREAYAALCNRPIEEAPTYLSDWFKTRYYFHEIMIGPLAAKHGLEIEWVDFPTSPVPQVKLLPLYCEFDKSFWPEGSQSRSSFMSRMDSARSVGGGICEQRMHLDVAFTPSTEESPFIDELTKLLYHRAGATDCRTEQEYLQECRFASLIQQLDRLGIAVFDASSFVREKTCVYDLLYIRVLRTTDLTVSQKPPSAGMKLSDFDLS